MDKKSFFKSLKFSIASLIWAYCFIKIFIFDVDVYFLKSVDEELLFLIKYKFFILIALTSCFWLILGQKILFSFIGFTILLPLRILCWELPKFLYKKGNWNLVFAILDAASSSFVSIRYNFISMTLFILAFLVSLLSYDRTALTIASSILLALTFSAYVRRIYFIFKPSTIYSFFNEIISKWDLHKSNSFRLDDELKSKELSTLNEQQVKKWTSNLESTVLFNQSCLFAAKKLRNYQKSGLNIVAYIFMILFLILLTIGSFTAVNWSIFKLNQANFQYETVPTFFTFFYYSFNNLVLNSVHEISAAAPYSQSVLMLQYFFAAFILGTTISLIFSHRAQKHTEELDETIKNIEKEGAKMELIIRDEYQINTIEEAIAELEKMKSSSIKLILSISKNIR